jgi:hypothetical protein
MNKSWKSNSLSVIIFVAALAVGPACQPGHTDEKPPAPAIEEEPVSRTGATYEVSITMDEDGVEGWSNLRPIELRPGETVNFVATDSTIWILIPEGLLEHAGGTGAWCQTDAFVAFAVDQKGTAVRVPENFPSEDRQFHYSVLARRGEHWGYVHGNNPPPGMIIRGSGG